MLVKILPSIFEIQIAENHRKSCQSIYSSIETTFENLEQKKWGSLFSSANFE
jgi:hypothetical protein